MNYLVLCQKNIYLENNNNNLAGEKIKIYNFDKGSFINNMLGIDNLVCYDIIYLKEEYIIICSNNNNIKIMNFIISETYMHLTIILKIKIDISIIKMIPLYFFQSMIFKI